MFHVILFLTRRRRTREKKVSSLIIQQQFPFLGVFERETDFQRFWTGLVLEEKASLEKEEKLFVSSSSLMGISSSSSSSTFSTLACTRF